MLPKRLRFGGAGIPARCRGRRAYAERALAFPTLDGSPNVLLVSVKDFATWAVDSYHVELALLENLRFAIVYT
jgi:hypothetical protein